MKIGKSQSELSHKHIFKKMARKKGCDKFCKASTLCLLCYLPRYCSAVGRAWRWRELKSGQMLGGTCILHTQRHGGHRRMSMWTTSFFLFRFLVCPQMNIHNKFCFQICWLHFVCELRTWGPTSMEEDTWFMFIFATTPRTFQLYKLMSCFASNSHFNNIRNQNQTAVKSATSQRCGTTHETKNF